MIAALRRWFRRWDVEKAWPRPEEHGTANGIEWRRYHTGAWS
jgi:hypothetical protein